MQRAGLTKLDDANYRRDELWYKNQREDEHGEKNASPSPARYVEMVGKGPGPCEKNKCVELEQQAEVTVPSVEIGPAGHKELCELSGKVDLGAGNVTGGDVSALMVAELLFIRQRREM